MKIIENCWDLIETYNCQYGAHVFDGVNAKIYVNHWLDVDGVLVNEFSRKNDAGFVGHCLLVFCGVRSFIFEVSMNVNEGDKIVWKDPIRFNYSGRTEGEIREYSFEGSLHGFPSSVTIRIEAKSFELHILERDEPAKEG
ncbi:hypothetical protein D3C86_1324260 [compost metagenome]